MQTQISQMTKLAVLATLGFVCAAGTVAAQEMIRFEAPCKAGASSLRQTLVVLDEAIVSPDPVGHPSHLRWTRPILDSADLVGPASAGRLLPRERLTIYLARRATSDLSPLFVGCSPNMESAEIERMRAERSSISSFIFGSVERDLEAQRKSFDAAIRDAIAQVRKAVPTSDGPHRSGTLTGLLPPLRALSQSIDLSRGVPRIVILSPFTVEPATIKDTRTAREAGFAVGADAGLDLRRAEIVALGFSGNPGQHLQSHVEAFFLRSKGQLVGWRSDGLPQLPDAPVAVRIFGGTADYGDISAPIQIRIATDAQGNLVNSWVEVTAGRSLASPISGKAICRSKDACEVKGDGRLLGQAWNPEPKERPIFDERFAWSGMRYFEMSFNGTSGRVKISDPLVAGINLPAPGGGTRRIEAWVFDVRRTDEQQF
jgi:hypothetical protein